MNARAIVVLVAVVVTRSSIARGDTPTMGVGITSDSNFYLYAPKDPGKACPLKFTKVGNEWRSPSTQSTECYDPSTHCDALYQALDEGSLACSDGKRTISALEVPASVADVSYDKEVHWYVPSAPADLIVPTSSCTATSGAGGKATCTMTQTTDQRGFHVFSFNVAKAMDIVEVTAEFQVSAEKKNAKKEQPVHSLRIRLANPCRPLATLPALIPGAAREVMTLDNTCGAFGAVQLAKEAVGGTGDDKTSGTTTTLTGVITCASSPEPDNTKEGATMRKGFEAPPTCTLEVDDIPEDVTGGTWLVSSPEGDRFALELQGAVAPTAGGGHIESSDPYLEGSMSAVKSAPPANDADAVTNAPTIAATDATSAIATYARGEQVTNASALHVPFKDHLEWEACSTGFVEVVEPTHDDTAPPLTADPECHWILNGVVHYHTHGELAQSISVEVKAYAKESVEKEAPAVRPAPSVETTVVLASGSRMESVPFPIRHNTFVVCGGGQGWTPDSGRGATKHKGDCRIRIYRSADLVDKDGNSIAIAYGPQRFQITAQESDSQVEAKKSFVDFDPRDFFVEHVPCTGRRGDGGKEPCIELPIPRELIDDEKDLIYHLEPEDGGGVVYRTPYGSKDDSQFDATILSASGVNWYGLPLRSYFSIPVNVYSIAMPARAAALKDSSHTAAASQEFLATGVEFSLEFYNYRYRESFAAKLVFEALFIDAKGVQLPRLAFGVSLTQPLLGKDGKDGSANGSLSILYDHDLDGGGSHFLLVFSADLFKIAPSS